MSSYKIPPYTLYFDPEKKVYVCKVDNTEFIFRKKPYDTQVALVKAMRCCFESNSVGIFESPTGTGKSMSIVSSVLSWLGDVRRGKIHISPKDLPGKQSIPSFVQKWKGLNDLLRFKEQILLKRRRKRLLTEKENTVDTDLPFSPQKNEQFLDQALTSRHAESALPKIILASRTHSQLNQLANEFKSNLSHMDHSNGLESIIVLPLASRVQTCLNSGVLERSKADNISLNDLCVSIGKDCLYREENKISAFIKSMEGLKYDNSSKSSRSYTLSDIEEVGKLCNACPYYATREALSKASIILTPYNLILDESMRQDLDIELEGCIVIFDEAHNIINSGKNTLSQTISLAQLQALMPFISLMCQDSTALSVNVKLQWTELQNVIQKLQDALNNMYKCFRKSDRDLKCSDAENLFDQANKKEVVYTVNEFLSKCHSSDHNFFRISAFMQQQIRDSKSWRDDHRSNFASLLRFFALIASNIDHTAIFVNISDTLVKVAGLQAGRALISILYKSLAVIMLGGTMQSQDVLDSEIFITPPKSVLGFTREISRITFPHVVPSENVFVDCWSRSPSGIRFRFTHNQHLEDANKDFNKSMIGGLAQIISNLSNFVPGGVVFFFSSYNYLKFVKETFTLKKIFDSLRNKKVEYFFEEKQQDAEKLLQEYRNSVQMSKRSVFLFAVLGGKLSEGINFSDEYGSMVCIAGLPYPNPVDIENETRMRYALCGKFHGESKIFERMDSSRKNTYYDAHCMSVVNQSIGRVIRHKDDHAAIIFLDERMQQEHLQGLLPTWVQNSLQKRTHDFDSISGIMRVRDFFDFFCKSKSKN